jgi:hypothetical protein
MNRQFNMPAAAHPSWQMMANTHRPTDGDALQAEIRRLRQTGLTAHDIASTLRMGVAAVEQALQQDIA